MATASTYLLHRTTCPHCWSAFLPEEVLWISAHTDLLGDPRLGPEQLQRFLPTRFTVEGNALDARGLVCHALACPKCHLPMPRGMLEMEPAFVSILGTPSCGKSYYLAALTWELRRILPLYFALSFSEADTSSNRSLSEYEGLLFLNSQPDDLVPLANLIRKTEEQGQLYDTVMYGNQTVSYPRPFIFTMQPLDNHPSYAHAQRLAHMLCLYDNAGESFQGGKDSTSNPVTQHLAQSRLLLFLFDPIQDQRFRNLCKEHSIQSPTFASTRTSRQETVLLEAAARVRRYGGLSQHAKLDRPLIVVVTKADVWSSLLPDPGWSDPWKSRDSLSGLDLERIERRSSEVRALLLRLSPEVVTAAESFARHVVYVPVSALGHSPESHPETKNLAIRPRDIRPLWVTVPLLYGMCRWMPGLIPNRRRKAPATIKMERGALPDFGRKSADTLKQEPS